MMVLKSPTAPLSRKIGEFLEMPIFFVNYPRWFLELFALFMRCYVFDKHISIGNCYTKNPSKKNI
jgi:hypothetical protein